uniref:Protein kinase domain-containing protein n=1 Tax=Panagrellus redivivus TaxID=6233 RepID=A0A7E4ZQU3_PANRE
MMDNPPQGRTEQTEVVGTGSELGAPEFLGPGSGAKIRVLGPGSGGSGAEAPKLWLRREDPERSLRNFENGSGSGAGGSVFSDPGLFLPQNCAKLVQNR